jgi:hypothetical protein
VIQVPVEVEAPSGNRKRLKNDHHNITPSRIWDRKMWNLDSQLQQRQICIAIVRSLLALLVHIVLEYGRGLRIVSIESVEDVLNVLGPVRRIVEGYAHYYMRLSGAGLRKWRTKVGEILEARVLRVGLDLCFGYAQSKYFRWLTM